MGTFSHRAACKRLWQLYRMPPCFSDWLAERSSLSQLSTAFVLLIHAIPYVFILCMSVCVLLANLGLGSESEFKFQAAARAVALGVGQGVALGVLVATVFGAGGRIVAGTKLGIPQGLSVGIAFGIAGSIASGVAPGITSGVSGAIVFGLLVGMAFGIASGVSFGIAGGIAQGILAGMIQGVGVGVVMGFISAPPVGIRDTTDGVAFELAVGISVGISFTVAVTRSYYLPIALLFVWPQRRGAWYPQHPVSWDQMCSLTMPQLGALLADYGEVDRHAVNTEIDRLIDDYPAQRRAALEARARLIARDSGHVECLDELLNHVSQLPTGDYGWLLQSKQVITSVAAIRDRQSEVDVTRGLPAYVLQQARAVRDEVETFRNAVAGLREPLASEFRRAATEWLQVATRQIAEAEIRASRERVPQVYRAGDPVDASAREAFVPRQEVIDELAAHVMANIGCPGLLLYARRRMGKSSCLRNLTDFLPSRIGVVHLNLQDPGISGSEELFCSELAAAVEVESDQADHDSGPATLVELGRILSTLNERLGSEGRRLLIGLDEYEYLDAMLVEQALPQGLPALFRTSIQEHRNLIWVFAGSHQIRELKNAQWPSALISVRTIEIGRFTSQETKTLLTHPLEHSKLWPLGSHDRPTFEPDFWGPDGIQRLQEMADGWPHLVILLAEICVNLVNQRNAEYVTDELFDAAVQKAVVQGDNVMIQLVQNESELPGEWDYLLGFKASETLPLPGDPAILSSLQRRSLIYADDDQVRLRVPLMQMWIETRG